MEKKLEYCPFKGAKDAGVAIDGRVIFKFDCPYSKGDIPEKTKEEEQKEPSIQDRFRFRVYDKYYKGYMQEGSIDIPKVFDGSSFIVEQCTGLKDKNDILIYEGAIIEFDTDDKIGVVKYVNEDACFGVFLSKMLYYSFNHIDIEQIKVIGNIHNHPELVNEK